MTDFCGGCITSNGVGCRLFEFNYDGACPCTNCILKMICDDPCNNFNLWEKRCDLFTKVYGKSRKPINKFSFINTKINNSGE